jgi:hypothetical protein
MISLAEGDQEDQAMSRSLPFWPKAAVSAWVTSSTAGVGPTEFLYTRAFPTSEFGKVAAQLVCEGKISGDANSDILVTPQVSNDGVTWQDVTPVFTKVEQASGFPVNQVILITTVGHFMRFKIAFWEEKVNGDVTVVIGGNLLIEGTGKPV